MRSDDGSPYVQPSAPGNTGVVRDHDLDAVLSAGRLHAPQAGR
ncbi:MAG: hypothetical protein WCC38_10625 [Pseudonocardiaceae bacterium]